MLDIHPFSENAVILKTKKNMIRDAQIQEMTYDTYINASYVKSGFSECHPTKFWLLAQALESGGERWVGVIQM